MSNESTTPGPAERPRPSLPQFDPHARADDTQTLPITPPTTPYAYAASPAPEEPPPPGRVGPRWTAKKTAVTAGLAIVLASAGAIGAAAAMPAGSTGGDSFRGPGGGRSFKFPGGGNGPGGFGPQNQQAPNQQLPNLQNGGPGGWGSTTGDTKTT